MRYFYHRSHRLQGPGYGLSRSASLSSKFTKYLRSGIRNELVSDESSIQINDVTVRNPWYDDHTYFVHMISVSIDVE